jgi:outer membrane protein OmpU
MNKMTKLGVSALCGSLAAISAANAGDLSVTGGVDMSWVSLDKQATGNPIGIGSNLTFSGSGEMDNGWNVALSVAMTNLDAYSNTIVTVTVPSMGDIRIDQGSTGTGLDRIDDVTPNVWEEAWGTAVGTGIDTVGGVSGGSNIEYTPNMLPEGLTARISYSPKVNGSNAGDKGSSGAGAASAADSGYDITLVADSAILGMEGLTLYGGISETSQFTDSAAINGDRKESTYAIKYAMGGFTLGYQVSTEDLGRASDPKEYDNTAYGVTFQINDDLSIGYNNYESEQKSATSVTAEATSIQIAYTMGGASIRLAETSADNVAYQTATGYDRDGRTLSVSLAF